MANIFGLVQKKLPYTLFQLHSRCRNISFFRKKKVKENPYIITRATQDDICPIVDLMWDCYHKDEPVAASIGLGRDYNPVFDEAAIKSLSEGLSIVAKCKYDGCVVGASINESSAPWDPELKDDLACTVACCRTRQLYHFWAYLQRVPNLWETYCVQKVFEIANVFVSRKDRGKGIAYKLMAASRDLGADCGYRVIRVDATSVYTAKICEKMKMKMIQEIPYCSYVGHDHEPIFKTAPPHNSVKIYVDTPHAWKK